MSTHKPGIYLRFRISPETIRQAAEVGGQIVETIIGVQAVHTGIQMKRAIRKQTRISSALKTGKDITDITVGLASAFSKLVQ